MKERTVHCVDGAAKNRPADPATPFNPENPALIEIDPEAEDPGGIRLF